MLRQRSSPEALAGGLAVGVFTGLAVPYGLQLIFIILAAIIWRKFNRVAALFGSIVSNPLTIPLLYLGYYRVGKWLAGLRPVAEREFDKPVDTGTIWLMLHDFQSYKYILLAMGVVAFLFALTLSLATYFITRPLIFRYQHRRRKRLQEAFNHFMEKARKFTHHAELEGDSSDSSSDKKE